MGKEIKLLKKNLMKNEASLVPIGGTRAPKVPHNNFFFPESQTDLQQDDELLAWRLRQTIINMVAFGVPKEEIATLMQISTPDLEKAYPHELQTGGRQLEVNLENNLVNLALYSPDPRVAHKASLDLLRHKFGWREASPRGGNGVSVNVSGKGNTQVVFHLPDQVTAEEWQKGADTFRRALTINSTPEDALKEGVDKLDK